MDEDEMLHVFRIALQRLKSAEDAREGCLLDGYEVDVLCYGIRVLCGAVLDEGGLL